MCVCLRACLHVCNYIYIESSIYWCMFVYVCVIIYRIFILLVLVGVIIYRIFIGVRLCVCAGVVSQEYNIMFIYHFF